MENVLVSCLTRLLSKDKQLYEHCLRVGNMAKRIAPYLDFNDQQTRKFVIGCCIHDVGKMLLPDDILNKSAPLNEEEWKVMRLHPLLGTQLILREGMLDQDIVDIVRFHHERWDGQGYPFGISGDKIPPMARMCSIMDAFDSMISDRPYRRGMSIQEAKEELWRHIGTQFDLLYVERFLHLPEDLSSALGQ
ncbi:diguanylate cyclase/phosphodiesterase [Paenibacillus terrae HPL-003]|uniref:Diguanylate cyclase/phosphodiesterase n=1 Tax=Paenibacillus terrae (strain HPL-003) TaxID=985665 RepID=G7W1N3_PAETH|nr:HD-GYP domain-containing protein [Paenibacillus terrae]AET58037.1 diguanylate cyclase/phosphodiesterase [Paenibacillus terrae HPL-003]